MSTQKRLCPVLRSTACTGEKQSQDKELLHFGKLAPCCPKARRDW